MGARRRKVASAGEGVRAVVAAAARGRTAPRLAAAAGATPPHHHTPATVAAGADPAAIEDAVGAGEGATPPAARVFLLEAAPIAATKRPDPPSGEGRTRRRLRKRLRLPNRLAPPAPMIKIRSCRQRREFLLGTIFMWIAVRRVRVRLRLRCLLRLPTGVRAMNLKRKRGMINRRRRQLLAVKRRAGRNRHPVLAVAPGALTKRNLPQKMAQQVEE